MTGNMEISEQVYQHEALESTKSFRILTLLPSASTSAPASIELSEVRIDEHPGYEALSYAWDDNGKKAAILCQGKVLYVTPNCDSALKHLRFQDRPRTLWIDAICINQTDGSMEKNQQVSIMGEIYSNAGLVIVWLGPGTVITDNAIMLLAHFRLVMDKGTEDRVREHSVKTIYQKIEEIGERYGNPFFLFEDLSQRSWFRRVWTLQEIALARDGLVQCGNSTISWNVFTYAIDLLREYENRLGRYYVMSAMHGLISAHEVIARALSPREAPHQVMSMARNPVLPVVTGPLFRLCSNSRDRVFGIHAVLKRLGAVLPQPDYEKPLEQVFLEVAKLTIVFDKSLGILNFAHGLTPRENWPSWVPMPPETMTPAQVELDHFCAAGRDSISIFRFPDNRRLTTRGKKIDTIQLYGRRSPWLGSSFDLTSDETEIHHVEASANTIRAYHEWLILFHTLGQLTRFATNRYGDTEDQLYALIRVLTQDLTIVHSRMPTEQNFRDLVEGYNEWQLILSSLNPDSGMGMALLQAKYGQYFGAPPELPQSLRHLTETDEWKILQAIHHNTKANFFHSQIDLGCRSKTFFVTRTGYIGIGPASIREGDEIVIVSGLQTPLAMRKAEEGQCYKLMGPTFVQGMMGGELWEMIRDNLEEFTIV